MVLRTIIGEGSYGSVCKAQKRGAKGGVADQEYAVKTIQKVVIFLALVLALNQSENGCLFPHPARQEDPEGGWSGGGYLVRDELSGARFESTNFPHTSQTS